MQMNECNGLINNDNNIYNESSSRQYGIYKGGQASEND